MQMPLGAAGLIALPAVVPLLPETCGLAVWVTRPGAGADGNRHRLASEAELLCQSTIGAPNSSASSAAFDNELGLNLTRLTEGNAFAVRLF